MFKYALGGLAFIALGFLLINPSTREVGKGSPCEKNTGRSILYDAEIRRGEAFGTVNITAFDETGKECSITAQWSEAEANPNKNITGDATFVTFVSSTQGQEHQLWQVDETRGYTPDLDECYITSDSKRKVLWGGVEVITGKNPNDGTSCYIEVD